MYIMQGMKFVSDKVSSVVFIFLREINYDAPQHRDTTLGGSRESRNTYAAICSHDKILISGIVISYIS